MTSGMFKTYGEFCSTHPWEVIVATLTITSCLFSMDKQNLEALLMKRLRCHGCPHELHYHAADVIIMTLIRCVAVLYSYYQFSNLRKLGSKYVLGIAGLFTVFSSFVFTSMVINVFGSEIGDLKDALFFFLLLIDLPKAAKLAQFALSSSNQEEVKSNIARGMALLGPTITLDTMVETLVIGVGTLSGVHRLEVLSCFACLSVIVNFIVFTTFYPACLSLSMELSQNGNLYRTNERMQDDQKPNPVVQRVKFIMFVGSVLVHAYSRWPSQDGTPLLIYIARKITSSSFRHSIMKLITESVDHIVILILLLTLVFKFIFVDKNDVLSSDVDSKKSLRNSEKNISSTKPQVNDLQSNTSQENFVRDIEECFKIYRSGLGADLNDKEVIALLKHKNIPSYQIEKVVDNASRGVKIRRELIASEGKFGLNDLPYKNYDYSKVMGACCENVIGYMPLPVGVAGPLLLDNRLYYIPMATTEGCLIASTNRGSRALLKSGIQSRIVANGMTRGPVVRFPSLTKASEAMLWMENEDNFNLLKENFDVTSRFARLKKIHTRIAGRYLFIRFVATTGDAMGMNMLSKGTEASLHVMQKYFEDMEILSLSGNFCTDKKPSAVNWIEGRGKSVVCEAIVSADIVSSLLKTSVHALVDVNISKNMIGSAIAGSIGGFNAHAANVVTAIFIATGQDPAQNVCSSNCITLMEPWGENGEDLYVSCTMPSIEIGTIGGGTVLPPQAACLEILGVKGPNKENPGENADQLARIICGTVLAGELSLLSALAAGHLVRSHLRHNRSGIIT